jgi:hypothetical protein
MNNFVSIIIAVLQHAKVFTEDEAEKLVKELHAATLPDNYKGAVKFIEDIFKKHDIQNIEQKLKSRFDSKK